MSIICTFALVGTNGSKTLNIFSYMDCVLACLSLLTPKLNILSITADHFPDYTIVLYSYVLWKMIDSIIDSIGRNLAKKSKLNTPVII